MRIALSMGTLRGAGSSIVGRNILRQLCLQGLQNEYIAWIPKSWDVDSLQLPANCQTIPLQPGPIQKFLSENVILRRELIQQKIDVLFSLGDTGLPYSPVPHLLLVQQPHLAYSPENWGFVPPLAFRTKMSLNARYFKLGLSSVNALTVQTHDMKANICARWGIPSGKVHVVPSTYTPFKQPPKSIEDIAEAVEPSRTNPPHASIDKLHTLPYLCYVATASPHKNFAVLAEMMANMDGMHSELLCHLTVTREEVPALVEKATALGVLSRFRFLGRLTHSQCISLIANAAVCVIPSHLESFGLPYYEALALQTPIVAADRGFAREACGDNAQYAPSNDGRVFARLVKNNLGTSNKDNLSPIPAPKSWPEIADMYLALLSKLVI